MRLRTMRLGAVLLTALPLLAQDRTLDHAIDTQRSTITVHVGKAGLLSAAAHNHTIDAPIESGTVRQSIPSHIEFTVETAKMKLRPDPKIDSKTQATIQAHMEELVLETKKYSEIRFRSSRVDKVAEGEWKVEGELSLHGVTKPVALVAKWAGDCWTTHTILKQTDFGITPITVAGGVIKVKNELELDARIFAVP